MLKPIVKNIHTTIMTTTFNRTEFKWHRTNEIKDCLDKQLYKQALYLAVLLPDICTNSRLESNRTQEKRYVKWVNDNITIYNTENENFPPFMNSLNGKVLYLLRNKLVHGDPKPFKELYSRERSTLIKNFNFEEVDFSFTTDSKSLFSYEEKINGKKYGCMFISIPQLVMQIISCAEACYESNPNNEYFTDIIDG